MRVFIERFILAILAPLVLLLSITNPLGLSWHLRIILIVLDVIMAAVAAFFATWEEWRWERLRGLWWLWLFTGSVLTLGTIWLTAFLNPPITWLSLSRAIDTLVPVDLRGEYHEFTNQNMHLQQQLDGVVARLQKTPEDDDLKNQRSALVPLLNDAYTKRLRAIEKVLDYLHTQLESGTLVAEVYDMDQRREIIIPKDEWEYLKLGLEDREPLKERANAGGGNRHLTGLLFGMPSHSVFWQVFALDEPQPELQRSRAQ